MAHPQACLLHLSKEGVILRWEDASKSMQSSVVMKKDVSVAKLAPPPHFSLSLQLLSWGSSSRSTTAQLPTEPMCDWTAFSRSCPPSSPPKVWTGAALARPRRPSPIPLRLPPKSAVDCEVRFPGPNREVMLESNVLLGTAPMQLYARVGTEAAHVPPDMSDSM